MNAKTSEMDALMWCASLLQALVKRRLISELDVAVMADERRTVGEILDAADEVLG